jgi:hypothetical protein
VTMSGQCLRVYGVKENSVIQDSTVDFCFSYIAAVHCDVGM